MSTPLGLLRAIHLAWFDADVDDETLTRIEHDLLLVVPLLEPREIARLEQAWPDLRSIVRVDIEPLTLSESARARLEERIVRKLRGQRPGDE